MYIYRFQFKYCVNDYYLLLITIVIILYNYRVICQREILYFVLQNIYAWNVLEKLNFQIEFSFPNQTK